MNKLSDQTGVSLLEVMISLLLMSVGILGMAGLQAATAKYRINTQSIGGSAQLVSELSERVRINADAAGPGFDASIGSNPSKYVLTSAWTVQNKETLDVKKNCMTTVCTVNERAEFDMTSWRSRVRDTLPQGAALVSGDRKSGIDVTLMWMDKEQTRITENEDTGKLDRALTKSVTCKTDVSSSIVHNCCPAEAAAPAGVRCLRMSFFP